MHFVSGYAQIFGRRQPARACANNADRLPACGPDFNGLYPALFPGGVGYIFFNRPDGHRIVTGKFNDAIAFAQAVLRTDTPADFGHRTSQV